MQFTPEILLAFFGVLIVQGASFTIYVVRVARYAGSAEQKLTSIDDHLHRVNGRLDATDERLRHLETDPKWLDRAIDLANRIEHVGRQNQALLQDTNERRAQENLPPLMANGL